MARIDLDARRAARREALGEPIVVVLEGEEFVLPVEMPVALLGLVSDLGGLDTDAEKAAAVYPLAQALLGPEAWNRLLAVRPSIDDLLEIVDVAMEQYAVDPPSPPESSGSSNAPGKRSRRTSGGSTASTSRRSPTGRKPAASAT